MGTNGYELNMTFDLQEQTTLPPASLQDKKERQRAESLAKEIQKRSEFL